MDLSSYRNCYLFKYESKILRWFINCYWLWTWIKIYKYSQFDTLCVMSFCCSCCFNREEGALGVILIYFWIHVNPSGFFFIFVCIFRGFMRFEYSCLYITAKVVIQYIYMYSLSIDPLLFVGHTKHLFGCQRKGR